MIKKRLRLSIKDKKLRDLIKSRDKQIEKRNFLELLRRAARTALR